MTLRSLYEEINHQYYGGHAILTGCGKSQEKATLEKDIDNLQKENKELKDKKKSFNKKKKISR